jgi:hypothetical protein
MTFTKKLLCSLACAGSLAIPASASALDTSRTYDVSIYLGSTIVPAGELIFQFNKEVSAPGHACEYVYEWDDTATLPLSAQGFVDEAKPQTFQSCLLNSLANFPSFLMLDPNDCANSACSGFDVFQQFRVVSALMLGETPSGELSGTLQLTGAVPVLYAIDIQPHKKAHIAPVIRADVQIRVER